MHRWFLSLLILILMRAAGADVPPHVVVLQYHHVSQDTPASTSLSPDRFTEHLQWLADNRYSVIALPDALDLLFTGGEVPDRTAVITFDDGYQSIYDAAFPILRQFDFPFTIFVNPEPHDAGRKAWVSWDEIREMSASGDRKSTRLNSSH